MHPDSGPAEVKGDLPNVDRALFDHPTGAKTLALMEVSGGSQSFNAVNQLRILGRWMRMLTIPNQSSVAKAHDLNRWRHRTMANDPATRETT